MTRRRLVPLLAACLLAGIVGYAPPATAQDTKSAVITARTWSAITPLDADPTPVLQSEPAVAVNGAVGSEVTVVAWTDSRNAAPDVYAAVFASGSKIGDRRVSNIGPHFEVQRAHGSAVAVEPSGRAFAVYSDGRNVHLVRYDVGSGQWLSRTQVTAGLSEWWMLARYPHIASDGNGNLVIAWEDFRNADPNNGGVNSKGSDIYVETCNGNTMACDFPNDKLNDDNGRADQRRPRLARSGNNVVAVWEDARERGPEFPRVYASFSGDGGLTWSPNSRVNKSLSGLLDPNTRDTAASPAVAYAPDNTAYAIWENRLGSHTAPADIYVARWMPGSTAWSTPWRVDRGPGNARALNPTIASSSAGTFAAWQDYRNGAANADIYTARWDGGSWTEIVAVTSPGMQVLPTLAASNNAVRLVWQDGQSGNADVMMAAWNGSGWAGETIVNDNPPRASYQMAPRVTSDGSTTYVALLDQRNGYKQLWLSRLAASNNAVTWSPAIPFPTQAARNGNVGSEGFEVAAGSGKLHAVWSEHIWPYGRQIYYGAYANGTWVAPVRLTGSASDTRNRMAPTIAAHGSAVAAVWSYRETNGHVQLYAAWDTGSGWTTPIPVLPQTFEGWLIWSSVALSGDGTLAVAWSQKGANGRDRLMVARRALSGGDWTYAQVSPTVNSDWCRQDHPQIRADNANKLHLVWSGCALRNPPNAWPHDSYIFYASSSDGGATWSEPLRVGLTIAQNDAAHSNDTSSRPALAIGNGGEVMVLYPTRESGAWAFKAALIANNAVIHSQTFGAQTDTWAKPGTYFGTWYIGDSSGSVAFDPLFQRYVVAFPDRRNGRSPRIYTATYSDASVALNHRVMIPLVRK